MKEEEKKIYVNTMDNMPSSYPYTFTPMKNQCCICFIQKRKVTKVFGVMFPFSKFGTWGWFCKKHAKGIGVGNEGKLFEYYKLFNL